MNCSPFDKWNRIFQGAIHQTSGQEGGVCEPMWTNRDRGGSAINTRSPQTKTKIAFQSSYLSSTPRPAAYERPDRKCLRFWRLRKIQSGRPWTGGGGCLSNGQYWTRGEGPKSHCLFGRLWWMTSRQIWYKRMKNECLTAVFHCNIHEMSKEIEYRNSCTIHKEL